MEVLKNWLNLQKDLSKDGRVSINLILIKLKRSRQELIDIIQSSYSIGKPEPNKIPTTIARMIGGLSAFAGERFCIFCGQIKTGKDCRCESNIASLTDKTINEQPVDNCELSQNDFKINKY